MGFSALLSLAVAEELTAELSVATTPLSQQASLRKRSAEGGTASTLYTTPPNQQNPLGKRIRRAEESPPAAAGSSLQKSHDRRRRRRNAIAVAAGYRVRPKVAEKYINGADGVVTNLETVKLPAALGAYTAVPTKIPDAVKIPAVQELVEGSGFKVVQWNGVDNRPILDEERRIVGVLVGRPKDPHYDAAVDWVYHLLEREGARADFKRDEWNYSMKVNNGRHADMVERLLDDPDIRRLAIHQDAAFSMWVPDLYRYYHKNLNKLWNSETHAHLRELKIFDRSVFTSLAMNFGPNVWTHKHRDVLNLSYGWCCIHALGNFNPGKGGQLVLWELKLILEFPPGSLILIPSSTITHSNIPIQPEDSRALLTQYCGGNLFRFVDNGFMTQTDLKKQDPKEYSRIMGLKNGRWETGLSLLCKYP